MNPVHATRLQVAATAIALALFVLLAANSQLAAQLDSAPTQVARQDTVGRGGAPSLQRLIAEAGRESDMRLVTRRYQQDMSNIRPRYDVPYSPVRIERERRLIYGYLGRLQELDVNALNEAGRAEYAEFRRRLENELLALLEQERHAAEWAPLLPFARPIQVLQERRRDRLDVDAREAAQTIEDARKEVLRLTAAVPGASQPGGAPELSSITPAIAARAHEHIGRLRANLDSWYTYYYGFDPLFTWWVRVPYDGLLEALDAYAAAIAREW